MASHRTTYLKTFAALLVLTATTFGLSFASLGAFQAPVALAIAAAKATLIALFFMHLVEQARVNAAVLVVALLLVAVFVGLTAADVATREPGPPLDATEADAPLAPAEAP